MSAGLVRVFIRFVVFVPLRNRLGDQKMTILGLGIFVVVYFLLGWVQNQVQFAIVLAAVSFSAACTRGILTGFLSRAVKPWEQGQTMGLSASLDSLAQIVGPAGRRLSSWDRSRCGCMAGWPASLPWARS